MEKNWVSEIIEKHREPNIILNHWRKERFDYYPPEFLSEFYEILDVIEETIYSSDKFHHNNISFSSEMTRLKIHRIQGIYSILNHNRTTGEDVWLRAMPTIKLMIDSIPGEFEWKYYFLKIIT